MSLFSKSSPIPRWFILLGLAVLGGMAAIWVGPLRLTTLIPWIGTLFSQESWVQYLEQQQSWSVVIFLIAHTIAALLGIPGTFLVFIGGIVFGLVWGTVWSVVGATLGAIAAFCVARYCLRQWVEQRFTHHAAMKTLNRLVQQNDLSCVLSIRFAPISPFSVVNFLFGLTRVRLKSYAIGTFIGIIPGTLAYTWLGVTGHDAWSGKGFVPFVIALALLAGLSAIPFLVQRQQFPKQP